MPFYSPSKRGFYFADQAHRPDDCVQITDQEHVALLDGQDGHHEIVPGPDGKPVLAPIAVDLDDLKRRLIEQIKVDAEKARSGLATPGSTQALVYAEKFAEAQAIASMGEADAAALSDDDLAMQFPLIAASVGIEAATAWECAAIVIDRYETFARSIGAIERIKLTAIKMVRDASDAAAAQAAYEAITWASS